jgi:excisionase family DNA binding protein
MTEDDYMKRNLPRCRRPALSRTPTPDIPLLRYKIPQAAQALGISRTQIYMRIRQNLLATQKDGASTFITRAELDRYVATLEGARDVQL